MSAVQGIGIRTAARRQYVTATFFCPVCYAMYDRFVGIASVAERKHSILSDGTVILIGLCFKCACVQAATTIVIGA